MGKADGFLKKVSNFCGFSPDLLCGGMTITLYEGSQVVIAGYKKILEYDDNLLRISDRQDEAQIMGADLTLSEMSDDGLVVMGNITSIELNKNAVKDS